MKLPLAFPLAAALALIAAPASSSMPVSGKAVAAGETQIIQVAKKKKMTPRQEADESAKSGTVPKRYRSQVPKEYQQYIPFSK